MAIFQKVKVKHRCDDFSFPSPFVSLAEGYSVSENSLSVFDLEFYFVVNVYFIWCKELFDQIGVDDVDGNHIQDVINRYIVFVSLMFSLVKSVMVLCFIFFPLADETHSHWCKFNFVDFVA